MDSIDSNKPLIEITTQLTSLSSDPETPLDQRRQRRKRASQGGWNSDEDNALIEAVGNNKGKHWKRIAKCVPRRTEVECLHRWQKVLNPTLIKGPWTQQEDEILRNLVGDATNPKWSKIAKQIRGRIGKQCRERWCNQLDPAINKSPWTNEEEVILVNAHRQNGNKWACISKLLPGRTENNIKNHWNSSLKNKLDKFPAISSASGSESRIRNPTNTTLDCHVPMEIEEETANNAVMASTCCVRQCKEHDELSGYITTPSSNSCFSCLYDSIKRTIRRRARNFKNIPSIFRRNKIMSVQADDRTQSSNKEGETNSTSLSRRLDFDSL